MGTLTIRNLDNGVIETLKAQAKANQRSLEAEVRYMLTQRADQRIRMATFLSVLARSLPVLLLSPKQTASLWCAKTGNARNIPSCRWLSSYGPLRWWVWTWTLSATNHCRVISNCELSDRHLRVIGTGQAEAVASGSELVRCSALKRPVRQRPDLRRNP